MVRTVAQRLGGDPATKATDAIWPTQSENSQPASSIDLEDWPKKICSQTVLDLPTSKCLMSQRWKGGRVV
jgi:hypothetical protein